MTTPVAAVRCVPRDQFAYEAGLLEALQLITEARRSAGHQQVHAVLGALSVSILNRVQASETWRLASQGLEIDDDENWTMLDGSTRHS